MARDVTMQLEQAGLFGSRRQIQLLDNRELRVIEEQKQRRTEYSIDLLALDSKNRRRIHLSWSWLLAGLFVLLATYITLRLIPDYINTYTDLISMLVVVAGGLLAAVCFYLFWVKSSRRQRFFSRHAKIPLLELQVGKPSAKEYKQFVDLLEKRINNLRDHFQLSAQQQLSGEMRMLRRLSDKKIVSESDYKRAKAKLFEQFG